MAKRAQRETVLDLARYVVGNIYVHSKTNKHYAVTQINPNHRESISAEGSKESYPVELYNLTDAAKDSILSDGAFKDWASRVFLKNLSSISHKTLTAKETQILYRLNAQRTWESPLVENLTFPAGSD